MVWANVYRQDLPEELQLLQYDREMKEQLHKLNLQILTFIQWLGITRRYDIASLCLTWPKEVVKKISGLSRMDLEKMARHGVPIWKLKISNHFLTKFDPKNNASETFINELRRDFGEASQLMLQMFWSDDEVSKRVEQLNKDILLFTQWAGSIERRSLSPILLCQPYVYIEKINQLSKTDIIRIAMCGCPVWSVKLAVEDLMKLDLKEKPSEAVINCVLAEISHKPVN